VSFSLICKKDGATFDGFNLFVNSEEVPLQIQTRIREINPRPPPQQTFPGSGGVSGGGFPFPGGIYPYPPGGSFR